MASLSHDQIHGEFDSVVERLGSLEEGLLDAVIEVWLRNSYRTCNAARTERGRESDVA